MCVEHEDMDTFWSDPAASFDFYRLALHFAPVDAVHIMCEGRLCASGSRDRTIGIWDLSSLKEPSDTRATKDSFRNFLDGHKVNSVVHITYISNRLSESLIKVGMPPMPVVYVTAYGMVKIVVFVT